MGVDVCADIVASRIDLDSGQIMFNLDKAHMILDEMIANGNITETNRSRVLAPVGVLDKSK